jgi:hypothetical protein
MRRKASADTKGRCLALRRLLHLAEHLARARLIDLGIEPQRAAGFHDAQKTGRVDVLRHLRVIVGIAHLAHRREIVDLVRLHRL